MSASLLPSLPLDPMHTHTHPHTHPHEQSHHDESKKDVHLPHSQSTSHVDIPSIPSMKCGHCGGDTFNYESSAGVVCESCGYVQSQSLLREEIEYDKNKNEMQGNYVSNLTQLKSLSHSADINRPLSTNRQTSEAAEGMAKMKVLKKLTSIISALHLPNQFYQEAALLLEKYTMGKYGVGRWMELIAASCVYAVCRKAQKPLTLLDVADAVQCNVFKLGRQFNKLSEEMQLHLEQLDPIQFVERICATLQIQSALTIKIRQQAGDLLKLARKDWLLQGRIPTGISAAAVLIALKANHITYPVQDIASNLHIAYRTVRTRERELENSLLNLATVALPWMNDVSEKNLTQHLPFIIENLPMLMDVQAANEAVQGQTQSMPLLEEANTGVNTSVNASTTNSTDDPEKKNDDSKSTSTSTSLTIIPTGNTSLILSQRSSVASDPPSFRRAHTARQVKLEKVKKVVQRIETKSNGRISITLPDDYMNIKIRSEEENIFDGEDLQIERLLLKGVPPSDIVEGNIKRIVPPSTMTASDSNELTDNDLPEEEAALYIRSDREIELIRDLVRRNQEHDVDNEIQPHRKKQKHRDTHEIGHNE